MATQMCIFVVFEVSCEGVSAGRTVVSEEGGGESLWYRARNFNYNGNVHRQNDIQHG